MFNLSDDTQKKFGENPESQVMKQMKTADLAQSVEHENLILGRGFEPYVKKGIWRGVCWTPGEPRSAASEAQHEEPRDRTLQTAIKDVGF